MIRLDGVDVVRPRVADIIIDVVAKERERAIPSDRRPADGPTDNSSAPVTRP